MRYAATTGKPWCIIDCADKWREFEQWIHATIHEEVFSEAYRLGVHAVAARLGIYEEFPRFEEVNSNT